MLYLFGTSQTAKLEAICNEFNDFAVGQGPSEMAIVDLEGKVAPKLKRLVIKVRPEILKWSTEVSRRHAFERLSASPVCQRILHFSLLRIILQNFTCSFDR